MRRQRNKGGDSTGWLLLLLGGGAIWYFLSQSKVTTGTEANPITVAGVPATVPVSSDLGPTSPQGPGQLIYGPTDEQLGVPASQGIEIGLA